MINSRPGFEQPKRKWNLPIMIIGGLFAVAAGLGFMLMIVWLLGQL